MCLSADLPLSQPASVPVSPVPVCTSADLLVCPIANVPGCQSAYLYLWLVGGPRVDLREMLFVTKVATKSVSQQDWVACGAVLQA